MGGDASVHSPWHAGELAIQRSIGVAERMDGLGRSVLRDHLIDQHRDFYPLLPFIAIGAVDPEGEAWATIRAGAPGFLHSPDPATLAVDACRDPADPAERGMEDGDAIGLLGIDLATRRRNRLNGTIRRRDASGFAVAVGQSFGNCPRYIQERHYAFTRDPALPSPRPVTVRDALDDRARAMIAAADSFFVASYVEREGGARQVDVSHRGGRPGFLRIGADGVLTIPDFNGNLFFNTLGNLLLNPKAGLLFIDHASGDALQMIGDAEVILDAPEIAAFRGAERLWRFAPRRLVHRPEALPLRWRFAPAGQSPDSLMTGSWKDAAARLEAAALADCWRPFRVARIVAESAGIRSLHLEPADGRGLIPHRAGQHLPIRVTPAAAAPPLVRSYTLSTAPSDGHYRISVKREGRVSTHLHGLAEGDLIEARGPAGGFTIDAAARRPAVLLAAGIGITPLLAMLRHLVHEGGRTRHLRPTWLFQSARTRQERAFDAEIAALVEAGQGKVRLVRVLSAPDGADATAHDARGHIDMALLQATLPFGDHDFYLCGPPAFMQSVYDGLRGLSIADARIHAEAFGPASLARRADAGAPPPVPASPEPIRVVFAASAKEARWHPGDGSLLELAEARGLSPAHGCRSGSCGTCRTRVLEGAVTYAAPPSFVAAADEALLCRAVPAASAAGEALHLAL
jgi:ferredoxin-NADP reductase/predicted pyridoxine 5'-phosphate oxidase superfamily flavin-nucleotide-binding protein